MPRAKLDHPPVSVSKVWQNCIMRGNSNTDQGLVEPDIARNCTTINPCQQDATIIRDAEIKANVVNQCGRTELTGNIDVGENTENAIAANQVTQVKAGGEVTVTIHQVNADGAGPYFCDLDESSNTGTISHVSTNLTACRVHPSDRIGRTLP